MRSLRKTREAVGEFGGEPVGRLVVLEMSEVRSRLELESK